MELSYYDLPIYVLKMHVKGDEKMLTSETFPILSYEHQDKLDELEKMVNCDAKSVEDMHSYLSGNDLNELWVNGYYKNLSKKEFFDELYANSYDIRVDKTLKELRKDKSNVVLYHARGGFYGQVFDIDENFTVSIQTNIGFGSWSYFHVYLKYKNIPIEVAPVNRGNESSIQEKLATGKYIGQYYPFRLMRGVLNPSPNFASCKNAIDGIAELYNMLVNNMEKRLQALVLDLGTSKMITYKYWAQGDIYSAK